MAATSELMMVSILWDDTVFHFIGNLSSVKLCEAVILKNSLNGELLSNENNCQV